jgi:hypothetical protein
MQILSQPIGRNAGPWPGSERKRGDELAEGIRDAAEDGVFTRQRWLLPAPAAVAPGKSSLLECERAC